MDLQPLEYPPTVANLIRHAARAFPEREFIVMPGRSFTFAETELQSRRLARRLLRNGITKGTTVGILFPQGPDFVVALLAVTRIGAVAVPLSTFMRGAELARAIRHTDVDTVLAATDLLGRDVAAELAHLWPGLDGRAVAPILLSDAPFLRRVWLVGATNAPPWATAVPAFADLADEPVVTDELLAAVEAEVAPSDRMVIVQTSGTTAAPKAIVLAHGAQVRQAGKLAQLYGLTPDTRIFSTMPFFWMGGLTVLLLAHLSAGAAIITVARTDGAEMLDLIEAARPTRLLGWNPLERLQADPSFADRDLAWVDELEVPPLVADGRRHSSLGMSETSGPHTLYPTLENLVELPEELRGSFGRPIPGMEHRIVDPDSGALLSDGREGEILVRGEHMMDGLLKQERSRTFDADGWYHTGDRGFFRDGLLYFTGRATEMIKTAGANVAPREVELAIEELPGVQAAFVVGIPDAGRGQLVACVVCPDEGYELDTDALRAALANELSSFKVPRRMLVMPFADVPSLGTGKIDKPGIVALFVERDT